MCPATIEIGEVERHVIEVWDRPARLRRPQRSGVTDLRAKRDAELHALGIERIVAAIVRRQLPQPRKDAETFEA